ncbi:uncharacterized protein LOC130689569 isoform X2 [Daphnia carinata]|uniref:uncharacterized protein LOC130689569 isoform X2 n=1 Tax=Daphnia carinata TaxID=120202 RepID=UPI00286935C2|nr:uncharacterized protein LOC130689569 isoform X2 [Daphnia carinata]
MMKSVVVLMCLVAVICAASEVDYIRRRSSVVVGKPMQVPVFPPKRNVNQQKRQVDFDAGSRPAAASARQQAASVPLQQAFRPAPPAEFRRPQQARPQQERAQQDRPIQERPQQEVDAAIRSVAPSSFASAAAPEQTFNAARDNAERPAETPIERPARQQAAQRPARPASVGAERPNRNPEYAGGFPSGFTSGLPSFDFQGRMPEPDAKSEGFMDSALNDFPNLKALGGFDAFPDVAREDSAAKRPAQNRPARPSAQKSKRATPSGNLTNDPLPKNLSKRNKNKPIVLEDDEAMLEPDFSPIKRSSKQPTDIADIIADSVGEEQRFNPTFHPNNGPYGRAPAPAPANPPSVPTSSFRSRRPSSVGSSPSNKNRQNQRSPYVADQFNEFVDGENGLLGSGNFDVLGGGVFRDTVDYQRPYVSSQPQYYPPSSPAPPLQHDTFRPHQPFFPSVQQSPPIGDQFGNFVPPLKPSLHQQQGPHNNNNNNNNYGNVPTFPSSFFNDDDFFSNFRDFADVNQDYRN